MSMPNPWVIVTQMRPGGQGELFEVRRTDDDGRYVLKRLKDPKRESRFEREIETTRALHAAFPWAFPELFDFGWDDKDRLFYVMPWFPGSLQDEIDSGMYREQPADGLERLIDLVDRMALLHSRDWSHRDLKPANVLVTDRGELVLADLGLVINVGDDVARETETWEVIGSRYYVAPEHEDGRFDGVDHRACDFYAFGKILWVLVTGQRPKAREGQLEPANRLSNVLADARLAALDDLCRQLLVPDPTRRLASWGDVRGELEAVVSALAVPKTGGREASAEDRLEAARAAARAFRDSPSAQELAAGRDRELARGQLYNELGQAALKPLQDFGAQVSERVYPEFDGHLQITVGGGGHTALQEILQPLRANWPNRAPDTNLDRLALQRSGVAEVGIEPLFEPPPLSMYVVGYILLEDSSDNLWMLTVPLATAVRGHGAGIFPPLLDRFASVQGPVRLGLGAAREAATALAERVCDFGLALATDYVEHLTAGRDVGQGETWRTRATP